MARNRDESDRRKASSAIMEALREKIRAARPLDPEERARLDREYAEDTRRLALIKPYRQALSRLAKTLRRLPLLPPLDLDGHQPSAPCQDALALIDEAGQWAKADWPTRPADGIEALRLGLERGQADIPSSAHVLLRPGRNRCHDCGMDIAFVYRDGAFRASEPCSFRAGVTPTLDLPIPSGKLVFGTNELVARFPNPVRVNGLPYSRARTVGITEALFREFGCVHFESVCFEAAGLYRRSPTRYAVGRPVWRDDAASTAGMRLVHPKGTRVDTGLSNHDYSGFAELAAYERFGGRLTPGETFLIEVPPGTYRFRLPVLEKRMIGSRRILLTFERL